ncbi:MAG TPA: ABC transporter ATP-binding protein [Solirubrobacterales bacterium]|nr:ABC transporter ATP-binding protein [Solirubrobacterales bacterium]
MLELRGVRVAYGAAEVVRGVDLHVDRGEVVGLVGPNGAGKTTLLRAICGLVPLRGGEVEFDGRLLAGLATERIAALGISMVPEGRQVFGTLSVAENLALGSGGDPSVVDALLGRFPILAERGAQRAHRLSGGEQQQLALARALAGKPRLLILDEPSLGLAPKIIDVIYELLGTLRSEGMTILLVEQNVERTAQFCNRCLMLSRGTIEAEGSWEKLQRDPALQRAYLGRAL